MAVIYISISFYNSLPFLIVQIVADYCGFGKEYPNLHQGGYKLIHSLGGYVWIGSAQFKVHTLS